METVAKKLSSPEKLIELKKVLTEKKSIVTTTISICYGTGCRAWGCKKVGDALFEEIDKQGLKDKIEVKTTGCHGFCERGPIIVIRPEDIFYQHVKPSDIPKIVSETIQNGKIIDRLLYKDPNTGEKIVHEYDVPFYKKQQRIIFGSNGNIDPKNIEDYIAIDGYAALQKILFDMNPDEVISVVKKSGLRGRGGGGFPAGVKWETCKNAGGDIRYTICNADEGDPGAFMDRSLLEGNPHLVIEGMIIAAYAIDSKYGYVYVRKEYPLAVEILNHAISSAREYGLLGNNILGSDFIFDIEIHTGAGAFICGESTALMASLEGKVGEPRAKYIHTVEHGLWDRPSNLNNVETYANVPVIINKGSDWYTSIGTGDVTDNPWGGSKGTKIFSLVGKINNTGLVEVPMGITLREIIYDIGGGIPDQKTFKGVQTGGPSGGVVVIPPDKIDVSIDFDNLTEAGSMMGSGGMIVMDEDTCMVDVAKYFMTFLKDESCGKCIPCREGIRNTLNILTKITEGKGRQEDLDLLEEIGTWMQDTSLCALGTSAPNPVLSTIRYFYDEYQAHIKDKKCPAGVCKELVEYSILTENCPGCLVCLRACPEQAIMGEKKKPHVLDNDKCIKCGICYELCKFDAILRN